MTRYTKASLIEYFAARAELLAVRWPLDRLTDVDWPRERLERAETALIKQGWQNLETEDELRAMLTGEP